MPVDHNGVPAVAGGGDVVKGHARAGRGNDAVIRAVAHADIDAAAGDSDRRAQQLRLLRPGGRVGFVILACPVSGVLIGEGAMRAA